MPLISAVGRVSDVAIDDDADVFMIISRKMSCSLRMDSVRDSLAVEPNGDPLIASSFRINGLLRMLPTTCDGAASGVWATVSSL